MQSDQPEEITQPHVCVVTAADIEFKTVAELLSQKSFLSSRQIKICQGYVDRHRVTLLQSEIGAVNFEPALAAHLAENRYDGLIVIGLAGAVDPKLRTATTILYDSCFKISSQTIAESDFGRKKENIRESNVPISTETILTDVIREAFHAFEADCHVGAGISTDKMVIQKDKKLALGTSLNALAVDMESYAIIQTSRRSQLPVAVLRVIIDEAGQDTPDFNRALTPEGRAKVGALLFEMTTHPVITFHFLRALQPSLKALRQAAKIALSSQVWQAFQASQTNASRVKAEPSVG